MVMLVEALYTEKVNPYSASMSILIRIKYFSHLDRRGMRSSTCHQTLVLGGWGWKYYGLLKHQKLSNRLITPTPYICSAKSAKYIPLDVPCNNVRGDQDKKWRY